MKSFNRAFWVIWMIEFWERFGYYGVQAIITLYFVQRLGYSQAESFYVFGSFMAFVYGFIWLGGYVGDQYLGAKRTLLLGAIVLMLSYTGLALSTPKTVFYALAGIVIGNALFKANPSSLITKMFEKGDPALDGAITMYYMAINIGSMFSMALTPIIAVHYGWTPAFWLCAFGLFVGVLNYLWYKNALIDLATPVCKQPLKWNRLLIVVAVSIAAIIAIANLLPHTEICTIIVYVVVATAFIYFIKLALQLEGSKRSRMFIALILMLQGVVFWVLYNQMPTSLTFFALHNINASFMGFQIPAAEYQVLNPIIIVIMSPILAWVYTKIKATHVTKFCLGMSLCALAFLILYVPKFTAVNGMVSPWWMVLTYFLQSVGELLISALGLSMVADLCPESISGFVMGIWLVTSMLAGPLGAWVGALTAPAGDQAGMTAIQSLSIYTHVFLQIGLATTLVAMLMWLTRPILNRYIKS